jgi:hypothetical protein
MRIIQGLPWGKLGKFLPLYGFHCTNNDSYSGIDLLKTHLMPFQYAGAFNPAVTITDQKSPWAKLGKNSQKPGTEESAIVAAGLNAPTYWNGIR